jgi:hypothetical protein
VFFAAEKTTTQNTTTHHKFTTIYHPKTTPKTHLFSKPLSKTPAKQQNPALTGAKLFFKTI